MQNSFFSLGNLQTLFKVPSRQNGIVSGRWGDIVDGQGWHEAEYQNGEVFRWAENDARIGVGPMPNTWFSLDVDVEPGPSLGREPMQLEVRDSSGSCVERIEAIGRTIAHIVLPVHPLERSSFSLHAVGDIHPVPGETRLLCYRVFALKPSSELLSPMLRFGNAWHAYEQVNNQVFRWAANRASIQVQAARTNPILTADLEPGPGTGQRPFRIDVVVPNGERIGTTSIRTREHIRVRLPMNPGDFGTFHFSVDVSMVVPVPRDPRELAFRTFGMTIS